MNCVLLILLFLDHLHAPVPPPKYQCFDPVVQKRVQILTNHPINCPICDHGLAAEFRTMKLKTRPGGFSDGVPVEECVCQRWTCPVEIAPGMCSRSQLKVSEAAG